MLTFYKKIFALGFMCAATVSHAQFAVIKDADGFVNLRDSKQHDKIVTQIKTNQVFWAWSDKEWALEGPITDWVEADAHPNNDALSQFGKIHRSRIKKITSFTAISMQKDQSNEVMRFNNSDVQVALKWQPFKPKQHKIIQIAQKNHMDIKSIDGKKPIGIDGWLPHKEWSNINVTINGTTIKVPKSVYQNFYEPNSAEVFFDNLNQIVYIIGSGSDGAGGYEYVIQIPKNGMIHALAFNPT